MTEVKFTLGFLLFVITFSFYGQSSYNTEALTGRGSLELSGKTYSLQPEANEAFKKMKVAAKQSGFEIKVVSSYRSYDHQKRIWNRKYERFTKQGLLPKDAIKKIIEYSTIPGTSRHHWGTDIDIVISNVPQPKGLLLEENFHGNGPFCEFRKWLEKNAASFGFYLVYTDNPKREGFKYEPWHYTYAPLSIPMLQQYLKIDILELLKKDHIKGAQHITEEFLSQYRKKNILQINPELNNLEKF